MANVKVTLDYQINDGMSLTFKAPCDCTEVTGLKVYYPTITDDASTDTSKTFTFKDAHGNSLTGVGNLFTTGAYVKVILDTTNNYAYIQNADTNKYLETKLEGLNDLDTHIANTDIHVTATEKNTWNSKADGVHTHSQSDITGLSEILTTMCKVESGTYTGTGKNGKANPNSLSFSFTPKVVFLNDSTPYLWKQSKFYVITGSNFSYDNYVTISGTTMAWYSSENASAQLNTNGETYRYVAIG